MKLKTIIVSVTLTSALALHNVGRAEDTLSKAANATQSATSKATNAVAAATDTMKAQTIIDKAKSFVADKKYQDALDTLQKLKNMKLTPEQQTMVTSLKDQIKKLIAATDTGKAIGGLLGK